MKKESKYWKKRKHIALKQSGMFVKDYRDNKGQLHDDIANAKAASFVNFIKGGFYSGFPVVCPNWFWYSAIAIYPFTFIRKKDITIERFNHEKIHIFQQKELFVVFAYAWYAIELIIRFVMYLSIKKAYEKHSMEVEARVNQDNHNYIFTRKRFAFLKYL